MATKCFPGSGVRCQRSYFSVAGLWPSRGVWGIRPARPQGFRGYLPERPAPRYYLPGDNLTHTTATRHPMTLPLFPTRGIRVSMSCSIASMPAPLDVLIPNLPQGAWRLLIEFLQCDRGFCHAVMPCFHPSGHVTVLISRKSLHILRGGTSTESPGESRQVGQHRHAAILAVEGRAAQR